MFLFCCFDILNRITIVLNNDREARIKTTFQGEFFCGRKSSKRTLRCYEIMGYLSRGENNTDKNDLPVGELEMCMKQEI